MGRKLVLTGTKLSDLNAPKLATIDVILPEAGALILADPASPVTPWPTFDLTSVNAIVLPNLAYAQAKVLVPSGDTTTLGLAYAKGVGFENDGVKSKVERSGKGGLAAHISQSVGTDTIGTRTVSVTGGSALNTYLLANKAHSFYFATWGKIMRGGSGAMTAGAQSHSLLNSGNNFAAFYTRYNSSGDTQYPTTNPPRFAHSFENTTSTLGKTNTPFFQDIGITDANVATGVTTTIFRGGINFSVLADQIKAASLLFYGFYAEDLTVSGRTYATVNALVRAKYEKDVKTLGGRYYSDTYSALLA
jgi:hypothetical protein